MSDDIVARLRMYANASIDGAWASVFRADLNIAADEIERLRQLSGKAGQLRNERDEIERLRREVDQRDRRCVELQYQLRDAAETELLLQQEICRLVGEQANMTSIAVAQDRGWDCFKCAFCGVVDTVDRKQTCRACNKDFYADE